MSFVTRLPLALRKLSALTGIAVVLAGVSGCGEKPPTGSGSAKGGRGGGGAAPVIVGKVQKKVVPLVIDAIGAVEAMQSTVIRSQVTGTLLKISIKEGQDVRQGDLLFELDARPFRNAYDAALADRKKILVQLENARNQLERYKKLVADAMVSQEQFQKIQDDARALEAQALSNESTVANAKLQLDYCSIRAPISGRTGNLNVHEGDLVRANDVGAMVTINQIDPIYVTFGVPQQQLARLNRYRAAKPLSISVAPPGSDGKVAVGTLTFVDNAVDSSTGTIRLKGTFANAEHLLWPGQFATVTMTLDSPEVLTIPSSSLQNSQIGQHVFVVKADLTAERREIVVERNFGADAVIAKGLAEGETVVTDGQLRVIAGRPVEIKPAEILTGGAGKSGRGEGGRGKGKEGGKEGKKKET